MYEASDRAEDFTDLLNVLSGFLPHSYLTARISKDTKCWQDVWDIIYQHYNCKISGDTLLDFENLKKESDENYLQYYERLLQHTRLHLAPANAEVGTLINNKMDCLTISLMNMVALNWLRKIDPNLIQIIRTEYSTKLKSGTQLAQLVPTIAPNVDNLLSRYSNSSVSKVTSEAQEALEEEQDDVDEDTSVRFSQTTTRYRGRGQASFSGGGPKGGQGGGSKRFLNNNSGGASGYQQKTIFCSGCRRLAENQGVNIDFRHNPMKCPRKFVLRSIQEGLGEEEESLEDFGNTDNANKQNFTDSSLLQNNELHNASEDKNAANLNVILSNTNKSSNSVTLNIKINPVHESRKILNSANNERSQVSEIKSFWDKVSTQVLRIEQRRHIWNGSVRKHKSPSVQAIVNKSAPCKITIDEGSEINVVDHRFCLRWKIEFHPTYHSATAAGLSSMKVRGQTAKNVTLDLLGGTITWNLGKCIVVENLGVHLLVGELLGVDLITACLEDNGHTVGSLLCLMLPFI